MDISSNFNNHSFSKIYPNNKQVFNLRYFSKDPNNNLTLNDIYSGNGMSKSEDKDYFDKLTKEQLNSLKLYKFNPIIRNKEMYEEEINDKSSFIPTKELIKMDFEKIIRTKAPNSLVKYLPQMAFQKYQNKDLPNPKNSNIKILLLQYQMILKYLSSLDKKMNKFNELMEQHTKKIINVELTNYGKEKELNIKIEANEKKINNLLEKINKYKNVITSGNKDKKRSLVSFVLFIKDQDNNFYCDLCPNEIFQSYKEVQKHSLNQHEHILKLRKKNYEYNNNIMSSKNSFEHNYIDTKMKNLEDELETFIETINNNKDDKEMLKNKKDNILEKQENDENKFDRRIEDKDLIILEQKLNILEDNQKKSQELLLENLNEFKNEIFAQLKNISNSQPLVYEENNSNINKNMKMIKSNDLNDEKNDTNLNNNISINKYNQNKDKNETNNFELGEKYQDSTILESYNNLNKEENRITNQIKNKMNYIPIINEENYPNKNEENNIEKKDDEHINYNNKNKIQISIGNINQPNFSINTDKKVEPEINNFAKKFIEREKKILFTHKDNQQDFPENYKILIENNDQNIISKNEDELVKKLKDKYNLNENDLSKSKYNEAINEIINKNKNVENEHYKAYFKNIISFLEINKDLNSSLIQ